MDPCTSRSRRPFGAVRSWSCPSPTLPPQTSAVGRDDQRAMCGCRREKARLDRRSGQAVDAGKDAEGDERCKAQGSDLLSGGLGGLLGGSEHVWLRALGLSME